MLPRIGIGYDAHRLAHNRKLILGGVAVPFEKGLQGHSDADVLVHAVMDALLGAANLGDIGKLFPPGEARYKDADSLVLLEAVAAKVAESGYTIGNIDSVIVAERPKLAEFLPQMAANIAAVLGCAVSAVSVKATTEEGMGFTGNRDGIAAQAVCVLMKGSINGHNNAFQ